VGTLHVGITPCAFLHRLSEMSKSGVDAVHGLEVIRK
jgi:hypothetical protein